MSDSEYEYQAAKATNRPKSKPRHSIKSESDIESCSAPVKPPVKRKSRAPIRSSKKRANNHDLFGLLSDGEESLATENASRKSGGRDKSLTSSISSRVANGSVVRSAGSLDGENYVEVRVYSAREARDTRPDLRYTKALVTLKLQLDSDHQEWEQLQKFLRRAKATFFADIQPTFYAEKLAQ